MTEHSAPVGRSSLRLAHYRVLDITRALAGPYCTMILADLGADVIKVESVHGGDMTRGWGPFAEGISVYFLSTNRNKRSIAVDLRTPAGREIIRKMAVQSDVFVENFRPYVAEGMGLGYEELSAQNPRLVYLSISGFGRGGPYETWPGLDQIAQGISGLMSVTGSTDSGPLRVGIPIGDLAAGMWGAIGVLSAVLAQRASGIGQRVDTSLLGSLIAMLSFHGQRYLSLGEVATLTGNDHPLIAPYGAFQTENGLLNIAVGTNAMWHSFCQTLEIDIAHDADYRDNAARIANREALRQLIEARLRTRKKEHWAALFIHAGIPAGPINRMDQLFEDPHVLASGCIEDVDHPKLGILRQLASPIRFGSCSSPFSRTSPPILGEHTIEVLKSFRFDEASIRDLLSTGVVVDAAVTKGEKAEGRGSALKEHTFGPSPMQ